MFQLKKTEITSIVDKDQHGARLTDKHKSEVLKFELFLLKTKLTTCGFAEFL